MEHTHTRKTENETPKIQSDKNQKRLLHETNNIIND